MTTPLNIPAGLPALEDLSALYEEMTAAREIGRLKQSDWEELIAKSVQAENTGELSAIRDEFEEKTLAVE